MTAEDTILDTSKMEDATSVSQFTAETYAKRVQDELDKGTNLSIISLVDAMIQHAQRAARYQGCFLLLMLHLIFTWIVTLLSLYNGTLHRT